MYFSHAALSEFGCLFFFPLKASFKKKRRRKKGKKKAGLNSSAPRGGKQRALPHNPLKAGLLLYLRRRSNHKCPGWDWRAGLFIQVKIRA